MQFRFLALVMTAYLLPTVAIASGPLVEVGNLQVRHDLQLLNDSGITNLPVTTWPLPWRSIMSAVEAIERSGLDDGQRDALIRLESAARSAVTGQRRSRELRLSATGNPRQMRSFESWPRERGEATGVLNWRSDRLALQLAGTVVTDPADGNALRPDGSYLAATAGNWLLSAGWQDRWWGPGNSSSMILSNNARPLPAIALQRIDSKPFQSRWLHWMGPWTLTAFAGLLDDQRTVDNAMLVGVRGTLRPFRRLEVGLSRTAQWCGEYRPCSGGTFVDLLLGNDNRGVNVDAAAEPGNQLAAVDLRWSLSPALPAVAYMQWTAEDSRRGGPLLGSWLRQLGLEVFGSLDAGSYRGFVEVAETSCRDGGAGFSDLVPDCAYEHNIYESGYRYKGRALGHAMDGDGLSYSAGATLVQSGGAAWTFSARQMKINRRGASDRPHSVSAVPRITTDLQLGYAMPLAAGSIRIGLGVVRNRVDSGQASDELTGSLQWSSH